MLTFDSLPQARVVRAAGQLVAPPPAPRGPRGPLAEHARTFLAYAIGLWPLTSIVLLMFGLLYFAGMYGSP
jgi:hypothetical protein